MNIQLKMPANLNWRRNNQFLMEESEQLGNKPLIISDTVMEQTGHLQKIKELLGKQMIN